VVHSNLIPFYFVSKIKHSKDGGGDSSVQYFIWTE
jgi:hypothetical protein